MKNIDIYNLARPNIRNLAPYSTARDECQVKIGSFLDANENPFDNGYNAILIPVRLSSRASYPA